MAAYTRPEQRAAKAGGARNKSAARTNLTSDTVRVHTSNELGRGNFRIAYAGTYIGGNRNTQAAACKKFKQQFSHMATEYFRQDFRIAEKAIEYADQWNQICPRSKEILVTKGTVHRVGGEKYLVEPEIRDFTKFTSNSGWIDHNKGGAGLALEAFAHYTYHRSGGSMLVCDLQGRYRANQGKRTRFELTDPAICSRQRSYGPTDLGEKGIETFFARHCCNQFCNKGGRWQRPRDPSEWFESSSGTSMFSSSLDRHLGLRSTTRFTLNYESIMECDEEDSDVDDW